MSSLADLKLSKQQLYRLFQISWSSIDGLRHDVMGPLIAIVGNAELLLAKYSGSNTPSRGSSEPLPSDETRHGLKMIVDCATRLRRILRFALRNYNKANDSEPYDDQLIAEPHALVQLILDDYPNAVIRFGACEPPLIRLIYPTQSLLIMLDELITNAIRHSGSSVKVVISWEMRAERFACTIDDSGPGISTDLSDSYLPLDALSLPIRQGDGLWVTWKIVRCSGGMLLFRRSPSLHGTQVLMDIPVVGYWNNKELRQFDGVYEHQEHSDS